MSDPSPERPLRGLFKSAFGEPALSAAALHGDGSARRLWRLAGASRTVVGAYGPDRQENRAFLGFSRHFRGVGLPVPEIFAEDPKRGLYLEEDLGDTTLFDLLSKDRVPGAVPKRALDVYRKAVRWLPRFQVQAAGGLDDSLCYPRPAFDRQSMMWDLNYFKYYFLRLAGVPFNEQALEDDFGRFVEFLLEAPRDFFLYRDFQSRNIMVRGGEPWFIDYQGGRRGALQYDIASLLYDAKADLPFAVRDSLLEDYLGAAGELTRLDRAAFRRAYPGFALIRILQALGAYGLRGFYERKTRFLQSIPYAVRNLEHLLRTAGLPVKLPALTDVLKRLVSSSALRQYGEAELHLTVRLQSFSYCQGMPSDEHGHGGGYVFDCRSLPNPGREERYARLTGRDAEVAEFLERDPATRSYLDHVAALIDHTVEDYLSRNFTDLLVAFGCTGGQHRSVYCVERLAEHLRGKYRVAVEVRHRVLETGPPAPATPRPSGPPSRRGARR